VPRGGVGLARDRWPPTTGGSSDAVHRFCGEAVLTTASHQSGTDRLAEVAATLDCDLVVNDPGDEPLLAPETIDAAVAPFRGVRLRQGFASSSAKARGHGQGTGWK